MICFTRGTWVQNSKTNANDNNSRVSEGVDYHCWKKTSTYSPWYHKMGTVSALMYLKSGYKPSNITVTDECYNGSGTAIPAMFHMTGTSKVYIAYEP